MQHPMLGHLTPRRRQLESRRLFPTWEARDVALGADGRYVSGDDQTEFAAEDPGFVIRVRERDVR